MSSIVVNNTPVVPDADADAARTRKIEGLRKTLYGLGAFQLFWGLLGMLIAFCWLSNLLTLCCGAIAVNNFSTLNGAMKTFTPSGKARGCCCADYHIRGLCIAIIVFACLEVLSFGITAATLATWLLAFTEGLEAVSASYSGLTYLSFASLRYIAVALILGAVFPVVSLAFSIAVMCQYDALQSVGGSKTYYTSQSSVTVVTLPAPLQQQYGAPGNPYMMQPQQWPAATMQQQQQMQMQQQQQMQQMQMQQPQQMQQVSQQQAVPQQQMQQPYPYPPTSYPYAAPAVDGQVKTVP